MHYRAILALLAIAVIVSLAGPTFASASIISVSPTVEILDPPPADVRTGQFESDTSIRAWAERQHLTLDHAIDFNISEPGDYPRNPPAVPGQIPAGTLVNSYFLHVDSILNGANNQAAVIAGEITFSDPILGIIASDEWLNATDAYLGLPATIYANSEAERGLEREGLFGDFLTVSTDRKTILLELHNGAGADEIRVITAVPEPSTWALLAIAVVTLGACRRFRPRQ